MGLYFRYPLYGLGMCILFYYNTRFILLFLFNFPLITIIIDKVIRLRVRTGVIFCSTSSVYRREQFSFRPNSCLEVFDKAPRPPVLVFLTM